jgi:hypothetical protein
MYGPNSPFALCIHLYLNITLSVFLHNSPTLIAPSSNCPLAYVSHVDGQTQF